MILSAKLRMWILLGLLGLCSANPFRAQAITVPATALSSVRVYLNPNTGRFWTMDSYEGNQSDPLSLHKYLYAHINPINRIDPSGHDDFSLGSLLTTFAIQGTIGAVVSGGIDYAVHRSLERAAKAAGFGFVVGGTVGTAFQGVKALLAVRAAALVADVTVTTASTELITATTDGVLLGVVDDAGVIQLFKSGPGIFINGVEILGHADLVAAGVVRQGAVEGFSVAVQSGQVVKIFVNSYLNAAENGFVLATGKTAAVLDALDASGAQIFGY